MSKLAVALMAALPVVAFAAPESYTMDPYHTYPQFEVDHLGFSKMRGRFDKSAGKFTIDKAAKTGSLELTVQTASLSTGDNDKGNRPRARDEHLRSADFFNVAEFPTMTYKATSVKFNGDNVASIDGSLTLLGVTKPLTLTMDGWKCGPHPANKKEMCGGNATGIIKRSDFGMKYIIPLVGDELKLWVEVEAYKD
ncbi:MAG: YceI family protein [Proteobacteria bacterium]|nr:YceI family protein [Pseudomonadota bacterium]